MVAPIHVLSPSQLKPRRKELVFRSIWKPPKMKSKHIKENSNTCLKSLSRERGSKHALKNPEGKENVATYINSCTLCYMITWHRLDTCPFFCTFGLLNFTHLHWVGGQFVIWKCSSAKSHWGQPLRTYTLIQQIPPHLTQAGWDFIQLVSDLDEMLSHFSPSNRVHYQ